MQKIFLTLALLLGLLNGAGAKDGYRIRVRFTDVRDSTLYLAHYFGKAMPTIYKSDSIRLDRKGEGTFYTEKKIVGGIYLFLLSDMKTYYEFLLNNGDDFAVTLSAKGMPTDIAFKGPSENGPFLEYQRYLTGYGARATQLQKALEAAKTSRDSAAVQEQRKAFSKELVTYRRDMVRRYPGSLLASVLRGLELPEVPEAPKDARGKADSNFAYRYYKTHYWDDFNFKDERLIHTPIYDARLDEYFNRLVVPVPDSVIKEADWLLKETRGREQLFNYTLSWLTLFAERSKVMGMDGAFVHLVEKYYARGDASWLPDSTVQKYLDRISKIGPNMIGKIAPDLELISVDGRTVKLSEVKARYTALIFYSPTCGHCQTEIPLIDSVYESALKAKGMQVFAVKGEADEKQWKDFIAKNNIGDWVHVWDRDNTSNFRGKYDVYSWPVIYLLDEKKIIRGKRLDHQTLLQVVEMLERRSKNL